jgi:hypothetical protein
MAFERSQTGVIAMTPEQLERRDFEARMREKHPFLLGTKNGTKPSDVTSIAELISLRREIPDVMDPLRVEGEWHFTHQKWRGVPWQYFRWCYEKRKAAPGYFGIPN